MLLPITYTPIGIIRTPFTGIAGMPLQPSGAQDVFGTIELNPELSLGLRDLEGFSHIILLYHFHCVTECKLMVVPFLDDVPHGIFATRAPIRPNAIGISTVRLEKIEQNILHVSGIDVLDKTPLLDIKPFYPGYDNRIDAKSGWLARKKDVDIGSVRSDDRFVSKSHTSTNKTEQQSAEDDK